MNAAKAHAKARAAMKRRADEVEAEEIEGGEINLIPYLDIVTNLMLFILAGVSAGIILGQINTTLPDHVRGSATNKTDPLKKPDEQPLQLVVSTTKKQIIVWSLSGLEGSLKEPKAVINALPSNKDSGAPNFDYKKLNKEVYAIASTRWGGKNRKKDTFEIILQADGGIPYETVIEVMDALRQKLPEEGFPARLVYPTLNKDKTEFAEYEYNPDIHPLFHDILFSLGFE